MNESQYIYLQKKQWRAITVDWNILSQNSNEISRLYCLTDFQVAWLLSMTEYFRWSSRWENCPCTQNDLEAMKAEMDYNLMSCLDFQTWQLQALYDNSNNALLGQYVSSWDGSDPQSVNPDAPNTDFDGDGSTDRQDALCTALSLWCYSYAVDWTSKASVILGVVNSVASFLDFISPVGGKIAIKALAFLTSPLEATLDALNNQTALDTVICDWKANLEGVAINPANWSSAVGSLVYTVDTDEYFIWQLFEVDSQLLDNFLSFVNSLGEAYNMAQIGLYICPCESAWTYNIDFTVTQGTADGWAGAGWTDGWFSGLGWRSQDNAGIQELLYINCTLPSPADVTYFSFTYTSPTASNFGTGGSHFLVGRYNNGTTTIETYRRNSAGLVINATRVQYDSPVPVLTEWLGCANNPRLGSPHKWYLSSAEIRGVGSNPF